MQDKPPIIQSNLLLQFPELIHGLSTKLGGCEHPPFYNNLSYFVGDDENMVKSNREKFFSTLRISLNTLAIPKQIHSSNIQIIDKPGSYPETDALITCTKNIFLIISTADCIPILIFDKKNRAVSAVHSGWRGTQKKILTHTINKMISEIGCNPEDLFIFIGPGICKKHFEVGKDVSELFDEKYKEQNSGKYFIDLKLNLLDQLHYFNIPNGNIELNPICSYEEKDYLHSYRRDKYKSGRMFAVIGITN